MRRCTPQHTHADFVGAVAEQLVQFGAADAPAGSRGKICLDARAVAYEPNAAKSECMVGGDANTDLRERGGCGGQQAFAAGFIDRRPCRVGHRYRESPEAHRDRRGQPRWTAADNQNVALYACQITTSTEATQPKNPGPSRPANRTCRRAAAALASFLPRLPAPKRRIGFHRAAGIPRTPRCHLVPGP